MIEINPRIARLEFLDFHAEFAGEVDQILVIGVDQFAAEFAKHGVAFIQTRRNELVMGKHASAQAMAAFLKNGGAMSYGTVPADAVPTPPQAAGVAPAAPAAPAPAKK